MSRVKEAAAEYAALAAKYGQPEIVEKEKKVKSRERDRVKGVVEGARGAAKVKSSEKSEQPRALTEPEQAALFLASELKRISDPFLIFDKSGMEILDTSEEYSADTLGEKVTRTMRTEQYESIRH